MDRLTELHGQRATLASRSAGYATRSNLTDEDRAAWDTVRLQVQRIDEEILIEERGYSRALDHLRDFTGAGSDPAVARRGEVLTPTTRMLAPSQSFRAWYDMQPAASAVDPEIASLRPGAVLRALLSGPRNDAERRALNSGSTAGYTLPEAQVAQVIDLARAKMRVIQAGAMTVPLPPGGMRWPVLESDPTAEWHAESATITDSNPTFGAVAADARTLVSLIKVPRELAADAGDLLETALERALTGAVGVTFDAAAMFGTGGGLTPLGLTLWTDIINNQTTAISGALDWDDLLSARERLQLSNIDEPTAVIWSPRTAGSFSRLKDGEGLQYPRPREYEGVPLLSTTSVPITQGGGSDTTVIVGDFRDLAIGIRQEITVEILRETFGATFEIGILCHLRGDVSVLRPASFEVLTGISN